MSRRCTLRSAVLGCAVALAACGDRPERPEVETGTVSPHAADTAAVPSGGELPRTMPAGDPEGLPPGVTEQRAQDGEAIFTGPGLCYTCHGERGEGTPLGPALNDPEWIHLERGDLEEIVQVIRSGVAEPQRYPAPMPPMGGAQLTDEQLLAVASYVYLMSRGR